MTAFIPTRMILEPRLDNPPKDSEIQTHSSADVSQFAVSGNIVAEERKKK